MLREPSLFRITAIEDSHVLEYDFAAFKALVHACPDIAAFYIGYLERHWIIEKEPVEIAFRHDQADAVGKREDMNNDKDDLREPAGHRPCRS